MSSLLLELSKQQKLLEMMEERGFTLCQQNGQRTYGGPPPNWGTRPPPSRDSEVFIGRIPRMCFEDELIPLFLSVGELYEFRLMLDFSGTNRGYGYAHYATYEGAMKAIKMLNKYEIRPGHYIGVLKSKNNCRLLFGNIKSGVTYETFSDFIRSATGQVLNVFMFSDFEQLRMTDMSISLEVEEAFLERMPRNHTKCQFAIVEYENHKAAAVARRVLIPKYGHILAIDWAVPPRERRRNGQADTVSAHPTHVVTAAAAAAPQNARTSLMPLNFSAKIRPVPTLITRPSIFDNVTYMPKALNNISKYFKYLINVTLYRSARSGEIPLNVYLEMVEKIVERINNLEHCGQAVQLIFNYLSWYKEKKVSLLDSESQKILQEVKIYSDSLAHFIFHRITFGKPLNPELEDYYCSVLPIQLNFIFHMAVMLPDEEKSKLCGRISASLQWFNEIIRKVKEGDAKTKEHLKAIALHSDQFLPSQAGLDCVAPRYFAREQESLTVGSRADGIEWRRFDEPKFVVRDDTYDALLPGEGDQTPDVHGGKPKALPVLAAQHSVTDYVPFMPKSFYNIVKYFKHLMSLNLQRSVQRCEIPYQTYKEIEVKVIDRVTNLEGCSQSSKFIIDYLCSDAADGVTPLRDDLAKALQDVRVYSNSFINYIHSRESYGPSPNGDLEDYYCRVLPHQLSFLYHVTLILTGEDKERLSGRVTEALQWLNELIYKNKSGDVEVLEFFETLARVGAERSDLPNGESVRALVREACLEYNAILGPCTKPESP